jgi:hypothetical protein
MFADLHILSAVRKAHAAIFQQHVALRHDESGVHLVLQDRHDGDDKRPHQASRAERANHKQSEELQRVLLQLGELLDDQPEIRRVMRHLVFVERALAKAGFQALDTLPADLLQHALHQLEGLVLNWSPTGLATLRSKMAVAIMALEKAPGAVASPREDYRNTFPLGLDDAANLPTVQEHSDEATLSAVYAALGSAAPGAAEPTPCAV